MTPADLRNAVALGLAAQGLSRNHEDEDEVMSDAPKMMYVRTKPNGALGDWHDATASEHTAQCAGGMRRYVRADLANAQPEAPAIDWEARRWEAMLAALVGLLAVGDAGRASETLSGAMDDIARLAAMQADALIAAARVQP